MSSEVRVVVGVIEDNLDVLYAMKLVLSTYGYAPELYSSAEEFIKAAHASKASCLIIDVDLGVGSGIQLARHLIEAGFKFPIIFMTGRDNEATRQQAVDVGCVALLHKPFSTDMLIEAMAKALA